VADEHPAMTSASSNSTCVDKPAPARSLTASTDRDRIATPRTDRLRLLEPLREFRDQPHDLRRAPLPLLSTLTLPSGTIGRSKNAKSAVIARSHRVAVRRATEPSGRGFQSPNSG
jgi:hypothetical protein